MYTAQTVSGSYAEFCVAKEGHTFKLPEGLTFAEGAALGIPYFTAYRALFLESVSSIRRATFTLLFIASVATVRYAMTHTRLTALCPGLPG